MSSKKRPLLVIGGPTASGKSSLAVALAKQLQGEIVSADSMQIYKELAIGTARPTQEEMQGIPHHLIGFLTLSESYNVAQYAKDAREIIQTIGDKQKLPILCGGTGLYIQAITQNILFSESKTNYSYRESLKRRAMEKGGKTLLKELETIDPQTASRLHENDIGRIIRALEVYQLTGETMSQQIAKSKKESSPFDVCYIMLDFRDREKLYSRINVRVDTMLKNGLLEEAKMIYQSPNAPTAMQAIGYKELFPYFEGKSSLEEAIENIKQSTRRYAKRQLSWFRHVEGVIPIYVDEFSSFEELLSFAVKQVQF